MARLTAAQRRNLPKSAFGLPEEEKYPTDTRKRAVLAKGYATTEMEKGDLSKRKKRKIDRKANMKLYGQTTVPKENSKKRNTKRNSNSDDGAIDRLVSNY